MAALIAAACGDDGGGGASSSGNASTTAAPATTLGKPKGGTFKFAAEQEPTDLNRVSTDGNAAWSKYIMFHVWPNVDIVDASGAHIINKEFVTSAEVKTKSPQVVEYKIDPKAVWSDGSLITWEDFEYTWKTQSGKSVSATEKDDKGSPKQLYTFASQNGYKDIQSVAKGADDRTVVVTYATPYADWQGLFSPVLPKKGITAAGGGDDVKGFNTAFKTENFKPETLLSGGPYTVKTWNRKQNLVLARNDKYWGTPGQYDEIVFPFITDATQQPAAFNNKEIDGGFPQGQIDLVKQIQSLAGGGNEVGFGTFWEHVDFNCKSTALADVKVRQAIAKAIDRDSIVAALPKQVSPKAQVLNNRIYKPGQSDYVDNGKDYAKVDTAGADKLLQDAGYAKGTDGIYAKGGQKLTVRLIYRAPNPRRKDTADLLQGMLKKAGIDMTIDALPDFRKLTAGDFDLALFGWTGGTTLSSTESIYVPNGAQDYGKCGVQATQDLYAKANVELDAKARATVMNSVDAELWKQMHSVPLFQVPEVIFFRSSTKNVVYNGFDGPTQNAVAWVAS